MVMRSPHRLRGKIVKIRRGLALSQTHASPYYFARILDPRTQRYKVRSTEETNRIEARKIAEEYAQQITRRDAPADTSPAFAPMLTASFRRDNSSLRPASATRTISAQAGCSSTMMTGAWSITLECATCET